ncbi:MAG: hypothetical protein HYY79_04140 [Betaproteobacteria bacterium]|nr:hypothetical protein [Betaproteobacteria bacterium]
MGCGSSAAANSVPVLPARSTATGVIALVGSGCAHRLTRFAHFSSQRLTNSIWRTEKAKGFASCISSACTYASAQLVSGSCRSNIFHSAGPTWR